MTCSVCARGTMHLEPGPLALERCAACGVRTTGEPSSTSFDRDYYSRNYRASASRERSYAGIAREIRRLAPEADSLLDVGCGSGAFLGAARAFGFEGAGIDPSPDAVELTRARGFDAWPKLDELSQRHFDVVTILDVVAHVEEPWVLGRAAIALLTPDGLLVVKTPARPRSLVAAESELARAGIRTRSPLLHRRSQVFLFDAGSLARALTGWGLSDVRVRRWPEPVSRAGAIEVSAQIVQRLLAGRGSLLGVGRGSQPGASA